MVKYHAYGGKMEKQNWNINCKLPYPTKEEIEKIVYRKERIVPEYLTRCFDFSGNITNISQSNCIDDEIKTSSSGRSR